MLKRAKNGSKDSAPRQCMPLPRKKQVMPNGVTPLQFTKKKKRLTRGWGDVVGLGGKGGE